MNKFFYPLIFSFVFYGCLNEKADKIITCDQDQSYTWNQNIEPIISTNCATSGCHDANSKANGFDFTNYEVAKEQTLSGNLLCAIRWEGCSNMPKNGNQLSDEAIQTIECWAIEEAPLGMDTTQTDTTVNTCDTIPSTYDGNVRAIMTGNCSFAGCHGGGSAQGGVSLENYMQVRDATENGVLLCSIKWQNCGSNMPQGGSQLSSEVIQMIECWVEKGYPEN